MIKIKLKKVAGSKSEDYIVIKEYDIPKIILRGSKYIGILIEGMEFQVEESLEDLLHIANGWEGLQVATLSERVLEVKESKRVMDSIADHRIRFNMYDEVTPAKKKPLLRRLAERLGR